MKKIMIIIGVMIVLAAQVSLVMAAGFSPSSLIYELEQSKQECKTVTLTSDSETISVSDKWAENKDVEWKVSLFNTSASEHSISINYDNELSLDERQVEVCLSGTNVGEYHGVMLLREQQEGNSIVQMGIWLKVTISEPAPQQIETSAPANAGAGGGGGGGSSATATQQTANNNADTSALTETEINENAQPEASSGITGAVVGTNSTRNLTIIIIAIAVLAIASFLVYKKRIKEEV